MNRWKKRVFRKDFQLSQKRNVVVIDKRDGKQTLKCLGFFSQILSPPTTRIYRKNSDINLNALLFTLF